MKYLLYAYIVFMLIFALLVPKSETTKFVFLNPNPSTKRQTQTPPPINIGSKFTFVPNGGEGGIRNSSIII